MSKVSRRQVIKAGAAGVGVWAVPTVLVVAAGPASADVASGAPAPGKPSETPGKSTTPPSGTTVTSGAPARGELAQTGVNAGVVAAAGIGMVAAGAAAVKLAKSNEEPQVDDA